MIFFRRITLVSLITLAVTSCDGKPVDTSPAPNDTATHPAIALPEAKISVMTMDKSTDCNLEEIAGKSFQDGKARINLNSSATITGWVIDKTAGTNGDDIALQVISTDKPIEYVLTNASRYSRSDVRSAMGGSSAFENSGFTAVLPRGSLQPGLYNLAIVYEHNGKPTACAEGTVFEVQ